MIDKIKNNLTALIATVGLIGTIGTGFVKYGEIMAKIDSIDPNKFAATVKAYDDKMAKYDTNIKINEISTLDEIKNTVIAVHDGLVEPSEDHHPGAFPEQIAVGLAGGRGFERGPHGLAGHELLGHDAHCLAAERRKTE